MPDETPEASLETEAEVKARLSEAGSWPWLAKWLWVKSNGIPVWGRCTTHFSLFWLGLGCSLGVWDFDPWPNNPPNRSLVRVDFML